MTAAERLEAQLRFLVESDRLKRVERQTSIIGGARRENTAEHSWHLALFALVLSEHADEPVDLARVLAMLVVHDLVEIDAGDTFAYDDAGHLDKAAREQAAAARLFGMLPADQAAQLRALWDDFEGAATPESRFANAVDRLQAVVLNHANDGEPWVRHAVSRDRVLARNEPIARGSVALWDAARARIDEIAARGQITER